MAGKYALIIACSEYQDERLHRLPKTETDAAGMQRVLVDEDGHKTLLGPAGAFEQKTTVFNSLSAKNGLGIEHL